MQHWKLLATALAFPFSMTHLKLYYTSCLDGVKKQGGKCLDQSKQILIWFEWILFSINFVLSQNMKTLEIFLFITEKVKSWKKH